MKKTLYISDEAWEILKTRSNMSRYVSELIIADSMQQNKSLDEEKIIGLILDKLNCNEPLMAKCEPVKASVLSILDM